MSSKISKILSVFMIVALILGSAAGCGTTGVSKNTDAEQTTVEQKVEQKASTVETPTAETYPLKTDVKLTVWMELHNNIAAIAKNMGETLYAQELSKRTGVEVEYLHPAAGQAKEAFSIMIASGNQPDIIEYNWLKYPGGPNSAIANGLILNLNEVYDKYAPNVKNFLKDNPEIDKMTKTDEGNYYVFPFIREDESLLVTFGPVVRKDWLDELGLGVPETLDDWYVMLKAFKEKKNATSPLTAVVKRDDDRNVNFTEMIKLFAGGTESYQDFYIDNGKIKYGPTEPNRKAFFELMAKWFAEDLIDKNFATTDNKAQDANITSGKSGATAGSGGSGLGKWMAAMKDKDPKYNLVAVPFPAATKGGTAKFGVRSLEYPGPGCAAITAASKNVEIAARFLDYVYGDEGHMLVNFGIEGESYKLDNGYPRYADIIMKNPDKLPITSAMSRYLRIVF